MLPSCSEARQPKVTDFSNSTKVSFRGRLTNDNVNGLLAKIDSVKGNITLHITSTGGDELAAIRLGEELKGRSTLIVVNEYCLSACASVILLSSQNILINEEAIVGLHAGILGWLNELFNQNAELYEENIYRGRIYANYLKQDKELATRFLCVDKMHGLDKKIDFSISPPRLNTFYKLLVADKSHLEILGIHAKYFQGPQLSNKIKSEILKGSLQNWTFQNCNVVEIQPVWDEVWKSISVEE